jgi:hypothetical protein
MSAGASGLPDRPATFPFGLYDIFSYLIPGLTALLCVFVFEHWARLHVNGQVTTPIYSLLGQLDGNITKDNFAMSAIFLVTMICTVYVLGHLVSALSSFCLDRVYTAKCHGYPYETLLSMPTEGGERKADSKGFYRGLFFWLNLVLRDLVWVGGRL